MKKIYVRSLNFLAFFLPFIIYIYTLNPKIGFIDAGELITVCKTLGIAHPTGYPLFTILGRLFSTISIGSVAFRVNIISAIFSSLASLFLSLYIFKKTNNPLLSFSTSLIFAFSRIVWHQSTSAEVYSITFFFLTLLLFLHSSQIRNRLMLNKDERTLSNLKVYPEMSFKRGIHLLQMGCFHSSVKTFEFAARWDETKASSLAYQGIAYLFLDQYDTTLSFLLRAQEQKPDDKMLKQAIMMIEIGNTDKLKQEFKKLLGIRISLANFP